MFPSDFFSKPINAELATLLVVSPLGDNEKRCWFEIMPMMNDHEKDVLRKNLQDELKDFVELEKVGLKVLEQKIQTLFAS